MPNTLVTTVIPTYRRPKLLGRAVASALAQTRGDLHVLICDNASGDETAAVARDLVQRDARVEYFCQDTNVGSYPNFNSGIERVRTPFFSLLSDDDMLTPRFYEQALAAFDRYPDAKFVAMATMVVDEQCRAIAAPIHAPEERHFEAGTGFVPMAQNAIPDTWTGMVFRTEVRDQIGAIDVDSGPGADGGFVLHAAARYPFVILPGVAALLVAHENSTSGTVAPIDARWMEWDERRIRAIEGDTAVPAFAREAARRVMTQDYLNIGTLQTARWLAAGNVEAAARAANGVSECGHPFASTMLRSAVSLCQWSPARAALRTVRGLRRGRMQRDRLKIQQRFEPELRFIAELRY